MLIVVGLGNPEEKYLKTFHNAGWMAVGDVAAKLGVKFKKRECEAFVAQASVMGEQVIIARPLTYMNNSGRAVKQLLAKYKATPDELVVLYDDYDIPKGHIRIRQNGSAGTHNGMRSIIAEIGTSEFKRIRLGIRDSEVDIPLINYVLANIREQDYELFIQTFNRAADAVIALAKGERFEMVMTKYNG